jgi:hypothetical protein
MDVEEEKLELNSSSRNEGCTMTNKLKTYDIQNGCVSSLYKTNLQNMEADGKYIHKGWSRLAFHWKPPDIIRVVEETIGIARRNWKET